MLNSLSKEKYRTIAKNFEYLDENFVDDGNKFRRINKEQKMEEFIEYQRMRAKNEYEILRSEPVVCELIKQIHKGTIDTDKYPFVEPPKRQRKTQDG